MKYVVGIASVKIQFGFFLLLSFLFSYGILQYYLREKFLLGIGDFGGTAIVISFVLFLNAASWSPLSHGRGLTASLKGGQKAWNLVFATAWLWVQLSVCVLRHRCLCLCVNVGRGRRREMHRTHDSSSSKLNSLTHDTQTMASKWSRREHISDMS